MLILIKQQSIVRIFVFWWGQYFSQVFPHWRAKSRKYRGVFKVKSRVKTWQVRGVWSQQLEHKEVPKREMEPGVRKGKYSLLASHTRRKYSMETTHYSVMVKVGIKVMKLVESLCEKSLLIKDQNVIQHSWEGYLILLNKIPISTIKRPEWRIQAFHEISLFD